MNRRGAGRGDVKVGAVHTERVDFLGANPVAKPTLPAAGAVTAADVRTLLVKRGLEA